ncbi:DUF5819 family protein [Streptomyces turgidiscabies]|uniref:Uncharacterized protein n=1 Tax=Streptomyces turgidiscabies (strain Car8) TaxID=698760 RepID=L7EW73_STRT8|nr:DUF5819 family protein [Streptomyces turgidiscabies]ELP63658.1 hypothetical protein STRTUCAR8_05501 [Streptomyces turgidiscabies Car8]MDX3492186.1 DUF5819 family protein [Streptomyces turgidiscabies]GAQ69523.1 hypothetical protein T45_01248 [Streptomyces turgidiscabies]
MDAYEAGPDAGHGRDEPGEAEGPPSDGPQPPPGAGPPDEGAASHLASGEAPRTALAALSLPYQIGAALAVAVVAVAACVHLGMVFLHVAPSNTVSKEHSRAIDDWIYPEFEQNWKLFAPNPLQQNVAVEVRADVRTADGGARTTGWYDLSALDGRAIDGNLLPSHTQQNELRRAWDFLLASHDAQNRPSGLHGVLAERYMRRIVVLRLDREDAAGPGGTIDRVQVRSRSTNVRPPEWSQEQVPDKPTYRVLPWWTVPDDEAPAEAAGPAAKTKADGS